MIEVQTFKETVQALQPYVPLVSQLTGKDTTLERIEPLLELAGSPHKKLRVVHIAGTSGKTSTAYFTSALLTATGKRVGLTVSPHVDSIAERVQINGKPLTEKQFCRYLSRFMQFVEQASERPSYFELLYGFSLWVFAQEHVDYAVVETGLGGLHDATNIAQRPDKLCIITDIGFDHMHILGNTIAAIAAQKAGIIQHSNAVIFYEQSSEVQMAIELRAEQQQAELHSSSEVAERADYGGVFATGLAEFQQRNWLLARAAYRFLQQRDGLPELSEKDLLATQIVQVPGRMDRRQVGDKTIIMDGAHNGQKMRAFLDSFKQLYPHTQPIVLIAMKQGKEPQDVGPLLAPIASSVIITTFNTSQDLPAKSIDPADLKSQFEAGGVSNVTVIADHHVAYQALLAAPEPIAIIMGSFYLLSQLRETESLI